MSAGRRDGAYCANDRQAVAVSSATRCSIGPALCLLPHSTLLPALHPAILCCTGNATLAAQKKQAELMEAAQDARILEYQLQRDRREQVSCRM